MAGVIKKKKSLFEDKPVMEPQAKRMVIREADGGFVIGEDYGDKQKVAKSLAALVKCVKEHFGDASSKEDEDEGD